MWKWYILLSPIIIISIIGSASFVPLLVPAVLVLGIWALLRPSLALLLVFAAAGLPSILISLPGHTMRLVEPALLLCVVLVILYRPGAKLSISHALAILFTGIAFISFINVPDISTNSNAYAAD